MDINWYIWYATVLYKGWWINGNVKNPLNNIRRKNLLILLSLYGTNPLKLESDFKRTKNSFSEADFFLLNFRQQKMCIFEVFTQDFTHFEVISRIHVIRFRRLADVSILLSHYKKFLYLHSMEIVYTVSNLFYTQLP